MQPRYFCGRIMRQYVPETGPVSTRVWLRSRPGRKPQSMSQEWLRGVPGDGGLNRTDRAAACCDDSLTAAVERENGGSGDQLCLLHDHSRYVDREPRLAIDWG